VATSQTMWEHAMHAIQRLPESDALLGEMQAAKLLNLSSRTLQTWRAKGVGPAFVRAGRAIRYRYRDLVSWVDANTVVSRGGADAR
jgi:Helix-turn-helix domain